jgi:hypothetical protein
MRRIPSTLTLFALFAISATAQKTEFMDVSTVKVNPEKHAQFTALLKKAADANRRHGGDSWLTLSVVYGEGPTYMFVSPRESYGAVEAAHDRFMKAMAEGIGPATMEKMHADWISCLTSERGEFRRRRWDLSANVPDDAALAKLVAGARWVSTTKTRIRPGRLGDYEGMLKIQKAALEKNAPGQAVFITQVVAGGAGPTFYSSSLVGSLAELDQRKPFREILGGDFEKYVQTVREVSLGSESMVSRIVPDLSSMPKEFTALSPEFWNPKPATAAAKPKKQ